ncbi:MAG TPA: hypothetical protein VIP09_09705 [Dehalococcoidia bacterium]
MLAVFKFQSYQAVPLLREAIPGIRKNGGVDNALLRSKAVKNVVFDSVQGLRPFFTEVLLDGVSGANPMPLPA